MVVVSFSGSTFAWNSSTAITLWVLFGLCLIAYILQQAYCAFTTEENRIFPVHFLRSRSMILLFTSTAGCAAAYEVTLYYIPLYFQFTRGDSAMDAALRLLPMICIFIFFVMVAGATLPMHGRYSIYYIIGGVLTVIGSALMFTIDSTTSPAKVYGYEVLIAAGCGLTFQNAYAVATAKVPKSEESHALGFINVAQIGCMAFSLSIAGCLFNNIGYNTLKQEFAGFGFPDEYVRSALAGKISPIFHQGNEEIIHVAVDSVAQTIRKLFGTAIAGGSVMLVSGMLMPFEKVDMMH